MSKNYAASLSKYPNKGILGLPEVADEEHVLRDKVKGLAELIRGSRYIVVHTGAGLSTAAGIPDFRGPNGVWTAEKKRRPLPPSISFTDAHPTFTHLVLKHLVDKGIVKFIVSQNIDGLHLRSGLEPSCLAELHGNVFREKCRKCGRLFLRSSPCPTIGMKPNGDVCDLPIPSARKPRQCKGAIVDMVLDWRSKLPQSELDASYAHARCADLNIVLGSTLQIVPAGELPFLSKREKLIASAKTVICNLQSTKFDSEMDLIIHANLDRMFNILMEELRIEVPHYDRSSDPVSCIPPGKIRVGFCQNFVSPLLKFETDEEESKWNVADNVKAELPTEKGIRRNR